MQAEPLSKAIHDKAISLGIKEIHLEFSGGNDEGNLSVRTSPDGPHEFWNEIEEWAWSVYDYSGAGDGSDYGDDITYNLEEKKVYISEWSMQRHDSGPDDDDLKLV